MSIKMKLSTSPASPQPSWAVPDSLDDDGEQQTFPVDICSHRRPRRYVVVPSKDILALQRFHRAERRRSHRSSSLWADPDSEKSDKWEQDNRSYGVDESDDDEHCSRRKSSKKNKVEVRELEGGYVEVVGRSTAADPSYFPEWKSKDDYSQWFTDAAKSRSGSVWDRPALRHWSETSRRHGASSTHRR